MYPFGRLDCVRLEDCFAESSVGQGWKPQMSIISGAGDVKLVGGSALYMVVWESAVYYIKIALPDISLIHIRNSVYNAKTSNHSVITVLYIKSEMWRINLLKPPFFWRHTFWKIFDLSKQQNPFVKFWRMRKIGISCNHTGKCLNLNVNPHLL